MGRTRLCKLQQWCTQLAAASGKVDQLFPRVLWFSSGTTSFSTTKTGQHGLAEILKVALNTRNHPKSTDWNDTVSAISDYYQFGLDIRG